MTRMTNSVAINNANWVVSTFLTGSLQTEFSYPEPNVVEFGYFDPLTGDATIGTYIMNDAGNVTNYGVVGYDSSIGVAAAFLNNLNGGFDDFLYHAYSMNVLYNDSYFQSELGAARFSGYGQTIANMIDSLPGANPFDPQSTLVQIGQGAQYYA